MALWGKNDAATGAPKNKAVESKSGANGTALYANTTVGAFVTGQVVGIYGVDTTEATVANGKVTHPGWVLVRQGTGPLTEVTINAGGASYNNTDTGTISGGAVNGAFTLTTNSTGGLTAISVSSFGNSYPNTAAVTFTFANSTGGASGGSGATFNVKLGGRAGRISYETLVAAGTITGDGADDALFPDV